VDASDSAAVIVACASVLALAVMVWAIVALTKTLRLLQQSVDEMRRETLPMVAEMRTAVGQANAELERVDVLLGTAESISSTVDSASRLAYLAFSNPLIKAIAFASGTAGASRRMRRRRMMEE
jgi:hypothetical protein